MSSCIALLPLQCSLNLAPATATCAHSPGRECLFVNETFTTHIEGLMADESRRLLAYLFGHMYRPDFQCRWQWWVSAFDHMCGLAFRCRWQWWVSTCPAYGVVKRSATCIRLAHSACSCGGHLLSLPLASIVKKTRYGMICAALSIWRKTSTCPFAWSILAHWL